MLKVIDKHQNIQYISRIALQKINIFHNKESRRMYSTPDHSTRYCCRKYLRIDLNFLSVHEEINSKM